MTDSTPTDITTSLTWLTHLIERFANTRLASAAVPKGMSYARASLLLSVDAAHAAGNSARMIDISLDMGVTARTLTVMVDSLEKQELIQRVADPDDRRAWQLVLTPEGKDLIPQLQLELAQVAQTVVAPLTQSEQARLNLLLNKLIERDKS